MRRLHLKLFYLRTRIKREPQGITARLLGVRPATMSHLEQGRSLPTLPMLLALCRHYDVTPTYLLDDERPIVPHRIDRWSERKALLGRGDWLEVAKTETLASPDGMLLCPVRDGARFFDEAGARKRAGCSADGEARRLEESLAREMQREDDDLARSLERELLGQRKPRQRDALQKEA
jgi:transcriptional regulator with XRE-family HTH domain